MPRTTHSRSASGPHPRRSDGPPLLREAADGEAGAVDGRTFVHDPSVLSDAEILETYLARSGVVEAVELAGTLIERYGDLAAVVAAPPTSLAQIAPRRAAFDLSLVHAMTVCIALAELGGREVLSSSSAVAAYLKALLAAQPREQVWVLFLDPKNQLLRSEKISEGTVDHAPVYPREIVRRALELDASAMILVHNHPSGDPTPSRADIDMTHQVVAAALALKIAVHDHLVVGRGQTASLKALGLM